MVETNREQQIGYGGDQYSAMAKDMIKERFNSPEADIYFVSGGTQANLLTISSMLRPHQSVISAESGHIFTNEAGAIEATDTKFMQQDPKMGNFLRRPVEKFWIR